MQFKKCKAKFILHVEKDTVWRRFNEDKFWHKHNCILTHGGGQPPRGVRRLLHRLHHELKLPIYCVLDNDPWGYYIYSVLKQGSINLAYESKRMAIPAVRYLGLRSNDYERCELSSSVQIKLNEQDIKRAKQIASYPWFEKKKAWQKEIDLMLKNGFKLEVESLISKDISYVTEEYVPERLEEGDFLDQAARHGWVERCRDRLVAIRRHQFVSTLFDAPVAADGNNSGGRSADASAGSGAATGARRARQRGIRACLWPGHAGALFGGPPAMESAAVARRSPGTGCWPSSEPDFQAECSSIASASGWSRAQHPVFVFVGVTGIAASAVALFLVPLVVFGAIDELWPLRPWRLAFQLLAYTLISPLLAAAARGQLAVPCSCRSFRRPACCSR